jgi:hypothetical protein
VIIFGFLPQIPEPKAVAVPFSLPWRQAAVKDQAGAAATARLAAFRGQLYSCFTRRADALSELTDAPGEPLMLGIDVTPLARPDAVFADEMVQVQVQVRGAGGDRCLPGWPLSVLAGLRWGSSSRVDAIEARRLRPGEDHAGATVAQVTGLLAGLAATGRWREGGPPPLVMPGAGYPATGFSHALAGQPVQVLARLRSDRVFYADPAERVPGQRGAPRRHGQRFALADAGSHHAPGAGLARESARYGKVRVRAWRACARRWIARAGGPAYPGDEQLPIAAGTIQVTVERLPDGRKPPGDPVAVAPRAGRGGCGSAVEGIPAPVRSGALPPLLQGLPGP